MLTSRIFKLSHALEFGHTPGTVIIGDRVYGVETRVPDRDDPQFCEMFGRRRWVRRKGRLSDYVAARVSRDAAELNAVCNMLTRGGKEDVLQDQTMQAQLRRQKRLRFVTSRLLPLLRELDGCKARVDPLRELDHLESLLPSFKPEDETSSPTMEQLGTTLSTCVLGDRVMIRGQNVFDLVWIGRRPTSPCHLQVDGERYVVKLRFRRTIGEIDAAFRTRFLEALRERVDSRPALLEGERRKVMLRDLRIVERTVKAGGVVYEDGERSVVWGKDGCFLCCQSIPPFAVEGKDRKLRHFPSVKVAVRIDTNDPKRLFSERGALVLGGFSHHFVFDVYGTQILCMGHNPAFYARFARMPLEQGIIEYLNAARLVICAGHYDGAPDGWMAAEAFGRGAKMITERAARRTSLPIYRYYRG